MNSSRVGLIILAAGGSRRMGQPKQLLAYHGTTLIGHALQNGLECLCDPVIVVLGANHTLIRKSLPEHVAKIVVNDGWESGLSSSIRCGVEALLRDVPNVTAAIISLCDQPHVTKELLDRLVNAHSSQGANIAACSYGGSAGVPALFGRDYFPALFTLAGDSGAKKILAENPKLVHLVPFDEGIIDIDTPADYDGIS